MEKKSNVIILCQRNNRKTLHNVWTQYYALGNEQVSWLIQKNVIQNKEGGLGRSQALPASFNSSLYLKSNF